jgi:hypothetical protein
MSGKPQLSRFQQEMMGKKPESKIEESESEEEDEEEQSRAASQEQVYESRSNLESTKPSGLNWSQQEEEIGTVY